MNVAFFLIPKQDVIYLKDNATMRQAIEKMEFHRYSAIPLVDDLGHYRGTITEGDLLWKLKNTPYLNFQNTHTIKLTEIDQNTDNIPVFINSRMEDLISRAVEQNFIPVVDDQRIFIGIVRRREILEYCSKSLGMLESLSLND